MHLSPTFVRSVVVLLLSIGCSDGAVDSGEPLGSAAGSSGAGSSGAASVGTSGSGGTGLGSAGTSSSMAGATTVAGTSSQGGSAAGTSTGGALNQGGSAQAGGTGGTGGGGAVPTDGKGLYEANCMACHGVQGVGGPLGYEIQHPVREYTNWVVRNGRALAAPFPKAMEKFGTDKLSDAQLTLIWDYLDQPPQPTTGPALFTDYCTNCHGTNGAGGPTMRPLANEGKNVLKLVREGHNIGKYAMRHDSMPKFDTTRITDPELNLILAHVNTF